ncbi:hypothetical protein, partial [Hyphomonas sp. GM-8P]|uniref:hypothetical protein n=1 Tax=Hyphomonas sp. GM-8P TaxID=1280945 RepID=UPI001F22B44D
MPERESKEYRVLFAAETGPDDRRGTIIVSPLRDSWNDFGYQIGVKITIYPRENHAPHCSAPQRWSTG